MVTGIESITLFSENAKDLSDFYREKVGLKLTGEALMGEDENPSNIYLFDLGTTVISIIDHSEVKGKSREPQRIIFNLETDDIEEEVKSLDIAGVKKIKDIYHVQEYGYIATFEDPDGNYFQIVQTKPAQI